MTEHIPYRRDWQFFAIIIGIFLLIISSSLFSSIPERVGLENGIIAQSLHIGKTEFWQPTFDVNTQKMEEIVFMPLGYWLQSFFMSIFGDGLMFDKIYSFIFFILTGLMLNGCWRMMGNSKKTLWLPLLFAFLSPVIVRSSTCNYIEMPLTFFLLSAVYFYLHAITHTLNKVKHGEYADMRVATSTTILPKRYTWSRGIEVALSGLCLVMAFFIKGTVGIFPIVMPIILWLLDPNHRGNWRPWLDLGIMLAVFAMTTLLMGLIDPNFFKGIWTYWYNCIFGFQDYPATVASHFYIFYQLIVQLTIPLIFCLIVGLLLLREHRLRTYVFYWKYRDELNDADLRNTTLSYAFIICGCVGVIISAFSLHQYDYYVIPFIPFFAIAMSSFVENGVRKLFDRIGSLGHGIITFMAIGFLFAGVLTFMTAATNMSKNTDPYSELNKIMPYFKDGETVSVTQGIYSNSTPAIYLKRHKNIILDDEKLHEHLLSKYDEMRMDDLTNIYTEVELGTSTYHLYQRNSGVTADRVSSSHKAVKVYEEGSATPNETATPRQSESDKLADSLKRTLQRLEVAEKALKESQSVRTSAQKSSQNKKTTPPKVEKKKNYMPTY